MEIRTAGGESPRRSDGRKRRRDESVDLEDLKRAWVVDLGVEIEDDIIAMMIFLFCSFCFSL